MPHLKTGDKILIASLLLVSIALFALSCVLGRDSGAQAVVMVNGQQEVCLPLDEDTTYTIDTGNSLNIVRVENGEVFMEFADCPDGHCTAQGRISHTGEIIVCLPNRVTVSITGDEQSLDSVAY